MVRGHREPQARDRRGQNGQKSKENKSIHIPRIGKGELVISRSMTKVARIVILGLGRGGGRRNHSQGKEVWSNKSGESFGI